MSDGLNLPADPRDEAEEVLREALQPGVRMTRVRHTLQRSLREIASLGIAEDMQVEPGRGLYRRDRVRLLATYVLVASAEMANGHNAGRATTAAALRRLADQVERG